MSNIIRKIQPDGRVRLYEDASPDWWFVECAADRVEEAIAHHLTTIARHFGEIYERQQASDPRLVVAMHLGKLTAFSIGSPNDYPRGCGGDTWHIYFDDGRYEVCVSLWCMGDVLPAWQERIVRNARFGQGVKLRRDAR